jgi:uncharacterized protein (TIGR03086 family)
VLDVYLRTLERFEPLLAAVAAEQLVLPTPCTAWNVEGLLDHVLSTMTAYASLGESGRIDPLATRPRTNDGAPLAAFRALADRGRAAWAQQGALERECEFPFLGRAPGHRVLGIHAVDVLLHGWDLARATGQDDRIDACCAEFALLFSEEVLVGDRRTPYFRPSTIVSCDSDVETKLIAFSGRPVDWSPPRQP